MTKLRTTLLAALGLVILNTVIVLYTTRTGHATGGPSAVQVVGTASTSDVNNPAFQPVQFSLLPNSSTTNTATLYSAPVPAGKRLVIDYVSAQAQDLAGGAVGMTIGTVVNGVDVSYIVFVNKDDTNAVNQQVSIYADPGTQVQAFVFNASPATHCGSLVNISGHYVSLP